MCCRSGFALCALITLSFAVIFIAIGIAMGVRYGLYGTEQHENMVTDQRLLKRPTWSAYCKGHSVQTELSVPGANFHNSKPTFDAYALKEEERNKLLVVYRSYWLYSVAGLFPGEYRYHTYFFTNKSSVVASACSHFDGDLTRLNICSQFYAFVVKGKAAFAELTKQLKTKPSVAQCPTASALASQPQVGGSCTRYVLEPQEACLPESMPVNHSVITIGSTGPDMDYFYFVYYYGSNAEPASAHDVMKVRVAYALNRTQYDVSHIARPPLCADKRSCYVASDLYLLMNFRYYENDTDNELYNIKIAYLCEPNVAVYIGTFFIPTLAIIILLVAGFCYCNRGLIDYQPLRNVADERRNYAAIG